MIGHCAEGDVEEDGAGEEDGGLRDVRDGVSEVGGQVGDRSVFDGYCAGGWGVEVFEEGDDGCFAGAGGTDDCGE